MLVARPKCSVANILLYMIFFFLKRGETAVKQKQKAPSPPWLHTQSFSLDASTITAGYGRLFLSSFFPFIPTAEDGESFVKHATNPSLSAWKWSASMSQWGAVTKNNTSLRLTWKLQKRWYEGSRTLSFFFFLHCPHSPPLNPPPPPPPRPPHRSDLLCLRYPRAKYNASTIDYLLCCCCCGVFVCFFCCCFVFVIFVVVFLR